MTQIAPVFYKSATWQETLGRGKSLNRPVTYKITSLWATAAKKEIASLNLIELGFLGHGWENLNKTLDCQINGVLNFSIYAFNLAENYTFL
jgi:hypothetical protein